MNNLSSLFQHLVNRYSAPGQGFPNVPLARRPREYGVGSLRFDREQGIALNRLLLGVIAGNLANRGMAVGAVLNKLLALEGRPSLPLRVKTDEIIDPLTALTLGNILSLAAHHDDRYEDIGQHGYWDNQACTTEYTLFSNRVSDATLSQIRGGIDGYFIGQLVNKLKTSGGKARMKLSRLLKLYYDPVGSKAYALGYCLRQQVPIDERAVRESAANYLRVLEASRDSTVEDREIDFAITKISPAFDSALSRARTIPSEDSEWCSMNDISTAREQVSHDCFTVLVFYDSLFANCRSL